MYIEEGATVRSRSGRTIPRPQLAPLASLVPAGTVLDGDLIADDGRPGDFCGVGPALRQREGVRLSVAVFDVPVFGRIPLFTAPYRGRRTELERLGLNGPAWALSVASFSGDVVDVFGVA